MRPTALVSRVALAATILTVGSGCDKSSAAGAAGGDSTATAGLLDGALVARPAILYQVFGGRGDSRMLPVAALVDGRVRPLTLSAAAWQRFDSLYHQPGTVYTIYRDGRPTGTARVTRPMWNGGGEPLYQLPHCRQPTPLAAVSVRVPPPLGFLVEHLATNARIGSSPSALRGMGRRDAGVSEGEARALAEGVAEAAGVEREALARLDVQARVVATRAGTRPTLVATVMAPTATTAEGDAAHLLVVAERGPGGYVPSYSRLVRGGEAAGQYRRYVDHLDLTGDGVDELVLEGWSRSRESHLLILQYHDGRWAEVFQSSASWCRD